MYFKRKYSVFVSFLQNNFVKENSTISLKKIHLYFHSFFLLKIVVKTIRIEDKNKSNSYVKLLINHKLLTNISTLDSPKAAISTLL